MRSLLLIVALAAAAPVAQANVWERAVEGDSGALDAYRDALHQGDGYATQANAAALNPRTVISLVDKAIDAYTLAASKRPTEGEPYYRIAQVLGTFFTDCPSLRARRFRSGVPITCSVSGGLDRKRGDQASAAWEEFEKRAPLDPRVNDARFERAILRTKLVDGAKDPKPLLEAALVDYQALLDRADGMLLYEPTVVWGNLAETYMMLGRVDEAIDAYKVAVRGGASGSTSYGLAVALDRDGSEGEAFDVIRRQGEEAVKFYLRDYFAGDIFYVPRGEEHYYMALVFEAWGEYDRSLEEWQLFIKSGAHPRFVPRAKQHIAQVTKKLKQQPRAAHIVDIDDLIQ